MIHVALEANRGGEAVGRHNFRAHEFFILDNSVRGVENYSAMSQRDEERLGPAKGGTRDWSDIFIMELEYFNIMHEGALPFENLRVMGSCLSMRLCQMLAYKQA